jgi:methylthioribose-1-phosphate isomerase
LTSKDACLTLDWIGDAQTGCLRLLDQTLLPTKVVTIDCHDVETVWEAIRNLRVRGAPAIGVAAAYGCVIAARSGPQGLKRGADLLRTSRPTAVNLFWAIDRMEAAARCAADITPDAFAGLLLEEARALHEADRAESLAMGRLGADLIHDGDSILTHCNAGGLATSEHGTALAVIFAAHEQGKSIRVYADETRPLLQGARLTAWELAQRHIPVTLICDNMAAHVMKQGKIHRVIVGADRIAANGDAANKIGTYGVAVLASAHGIPF